MNKKHFFLPTAFLTFFLCFSLVNFRPGYAQDASEIPAILEEALVKSLSCDDWEPGRNPYCDTVKNGRARNAEDIFQEIRDTYHQTTNAYLNSHLAVLSGTTAKKDPKAPEKIAKTNIWEIYLNRKTDFYKYHAALMTLEKISRTRIPASDAGNDARRVFGKIFFLREEILAEAERARQALAIALDCYGEMRLLYPLHKHLEELISEVNKLRNAWENFVDIIARMPRKFINASR